jgi:serine protease Do
MRKLSACLLAATLSVVPAVASADPAPSVVEHMEWSSGPRLGVMIMGLTNELRVHFGAPSDRGVLVARVEQGSAAAKAGVKVGDVLVAVRGEPVRDADDVISALSAIDKSDKVKVDIVRDKKAMTLDATVTATASRESSLPARSWFRDMFPWFGRDMPDHQST